eukprot:TRINITY_DN43600_c0_g2_i4.p3 TRINITY_DN43600_c0_g2~~TRINITY_DN43600_c0_g2_i4.p3  ORF type:complete len:165 (-),score=22.89 TRINITY_DN43600_c0_g2_i4:174-668(-)
MQSEATAVSVEQDLSIMMACLEGPFRPISGQLAIEGGPVGFQSVFDTTIEEVFNIKPKRRTSGQLFPANAVPGFGQKEILCAQQIGKLMRTQFLTEKCFFVEQKRKEELALHKLQQDQFEEKQDLLKQFEEIFGNAKFKQIVQRDEKGFQYPQTMGSKQLKQRR